MSLLIAHFHCQQIVTQEQVLQALARIPPHHTAGIQVIRYDPYRLIAQSLSYATDGPIHVSTRGLFYRNHKQYINVVVLFDFSSLSDFHHVLYHEIGHFVFLQILPQAARDQWFYEVRPQEPGSVTSYGNRNSREDYCETYAYWWTQPETLAAYPLRQQFCRKWL